MKFSAILTLAATALAATTPQADMNNMEAQAAAPQGAEAAGAQPQHGWPQPPPPPAEFCTPGTYSCTWNRGGWRVCGTSHRWVYGGSCGWNQHCAMNWQNRSPYCLPNY